MMNIAARDIQYAHADRYQAPREVFHGLTLDIHAGECVGILGREGSGKTSLLNILGGLVPPGQGSVLIDGIDLHAGSAVRRAIGLRMGFTFQFPEEQFLRQTVAEEFTDVLRLRGVTAEEVSFRMNESLAMMGLDTLETPGRSPFSLSLGESRRLALALVFALRPEAAFLDEPTSGLDSTGVLCALELLGRLHGRGATLLVATHDVDVIAEFAGRVLILGEGEIGADGKPEDVLTDSRLLSRYGYAPPEVVTIAAELRKEGKLDGRCVLRRKDLPERSGFPSPSADPRE
jgi:energy-coupling factor transporter ATP-binding protein EcfA2